MQWFAEVMDFTYFWQKELHDAPPVCVLDLCTTQNLNTARISFIVVKGLYTHKTMVQHKYNLNHNRWAEIG